MKRLKQKATKNIEFLGGFGDVQLSNSTSAARRSKRAYHILFPDTQGNSLVPFSPKKRG
jgi:hypothetical protein